MPPPNFAQRSTRSRRVLLVAPVALVTLVATASAVCLATAPSAWAPATQVAQAVVAAQA